MSSDEILDRMEGRYFDREGKEISLRQYFVLTEQMEDYRKIAYTELPTGQRVSTIWLGLNHNFRDDEPPLIFETEVFPKPENRPDHGDYNDLDCEHYATEAEALAGHQRMVDKWNKNISEQA